MEKIRHTGKRLTFNVFVCLIMTYFIECRLWLSRSLSPASTVPNKKRNAIRQNMHQLKRWSDNELNHLFRRSQIYFLPCLMPYIQDTSLTGQAKLAGAALQRLQQLNDADLSLYCLLFYTTFFTIDE